MLLFNVYRPISATHLVHLECEHLGGVFSVLLTMVQGLLTASQKVVYYRLPINTY